MSTAHDPDGLPPPDAEGNDDSMAVMGEAPVRASEDLGEEAGPTSNEPEPADEGAEQFGPAPAVAGSERMRSALRARLFGDDPEDSSGTDSSASSDPDGRARAWQSGIISGLDTEPPDGVRRVPDDEPGLAERIGRFRILDRLGRGGMGVVYSAYDPELDRKVAIKLLRPDVRRGLAQRDAHARLLREAQAMARLSDPNVIVVHEVGTVDDRVFVAMEYIDGQTLGQWLSAERRPWREILDVFCKAGSGLAAAHRAGLVHRDFKPDNVLLGHDGQVRVLDFGLARSLSDDPKTTTSVRQSIVEQPELDSLATPLTRTGAVMGTPAYMSPEQYCGNPADARSDQFSFCVALYEGLCGARPFKGSSLSELASNVTEGNIRETPSDVRVPKHLLATLRRGLSVVPADRFESVEALLVELRRDRGRRWRWGGLVLGVGALASAGTLFATAGSTASDACATVSDELIGVWDDTSRADVTTAIEGTGMDYAPRVASTTVAMLDDYTEQWVSMAEDACGAALVAQGADDEHLRRRQCLDLRLAEVGALVQALREPDAGMAEVAIKATTSLTTGLSACTDPHRLAAFDVAEDPAERERLAQAHTKLARAKAQGALAHYDEAIALCTEVIDQARASNAGPLEAVGLRTRGSYRERTGDTEGAEKDLRAAIALAERLGDPSTRAQALITLIYVLAQDPARYGETKRLGEQARAVLEYIDADPLLHADLDSMLGVAERIGGSKERSLKLQQRSHERKVKVLGLDHPDIGRSMLHIGIAMGASSEHYSEAEQYLRQALESLEQSVGPHHPLIGTASTNLGNCLARQERFEEALPFQRRALEIFERVFGPDHVAALRVVFNLAKITQDTGHHAEAAALFRRGLTARERDLASDDQRLVGWLSHLARSEIELGHLDVAAPLLERSVALRRRGSGSATALARDEFRLARALTDTDLGRARVFASAAQATFASHIADKGGRDEAPKGLVKWLDEIDRWLAEHPPTG